MSQLVSPLETCYEALIQEVLEFGFATSFDFFTSDFIQSILLRIRDLERQEQLKIAGIGDKRQLSINLEIRRDSILWLSHSTQNIVEVEFFRRIGDFMNYLNRTCYTNLLSCEFHYAIFEKNGFYTKHLDVFKNSSSRRFSFILYLNEDWKEMDGGELKLYFNEEHILIKPELGRIVFFDSAIVPHEVLLNHHTRYSLTGWFKT